MGTTLNSIVDLTRLLIKDTPIFNELRGRAEYSDESLKLCAILALDDYNSTPPMLESCKFENFPSEQLLILGTIRFAMMQSMLHQTRNNLQYQDGGRSVSLYDKGGQYANMFSMFDQLWESKKMNIKRSINLSQGFGILRSAEFSVLALLAGFTNEFISPTPVPNPPSGPTFGTSRPTVDTRTRTAVIPFAVEDWRLSDDGQSYNMIFVHGLSSRNVGMIIEDPVSGKDMYNKIAEITRQEKSVTLSVPASPDSRFSATIQCFVP